MARPRRRDLGLCDGRGREGFARSGRRPRGLGGENMQFRAMRRIKQALAPEACEAVLQRGTAGVLALAGDAGYPYAVPLSYVYEGGKLYFHCAKSGHKMDAIKRNAKASFCVVDQDQVVPQAYTTYFRSVIVFGTLRIVEDTPEKRAAIERLAVKYAPDDSAQRRQSAIDDDWAALCMLEMTPEHVTGKEAIELVRARQGEDRESSGAPGV